MSTPARGSVSPFARYVIAGALGTGAQYAVLVALVQAAGIDSVAASTAGMVLGAVVNYWLNCRYTFRSARPHRETLWRFMAVAALGLVVNAAAMAALTRGMGIHYIAGQVVATGLVLCCGYVANSIWTFRTAHR